MPPWLPTFLSPLAGAIAAGIAIPSLLILYYLKLRRREQEVPSTLLWKKAVQDLQVNAPFQKLRRNLLLLLQMLLLLLLLLAFARPVINYAPGAGRVSVILIDRSASMSARDVDGRSRLDEAKKQARAIVDSMGRDQTAMLIAFDDSAQTLQPFTTDRVALKNAIDLIEPTDRKTRLKLAYGLAEAQAAAFVPEQLRTNADPPDVFVFSDGRVLDNTDLSIRANVTYHQIGSPDAGNVAIVALSAKRNYERPTEVQIFARLANFGPEPLSGVPVKLSIDGNVKSVASVSLPPERWTEEQRTTAEKNGFVARDSIEFPPLDLTTSAVIQVEQMQKDGDVLSADDVASVVVLPPKSLNILLVTDGNYFLEKLFEPRFESLIAQSKATMTPAQYEQQQPTDVDVVVFDRYVPKFLPDAGAFISFGSVPDGLGVKRVMEANGVIPQTVSDVGVLDWKRDHPILRHLVLGRLFAAEMLRVEVPPSSEVLMDGLKGPMLLLDRQGRRTHLIVTFDVLQSNWPLRVSFPMFLNNALQFLAAGSDLNLRQSFDPGATPKIPRESLQKLPSLPKIVRLTGPAGDRTVPVPETGDFALPALNKVGVYRLDPQVPQFETLAVNLLDPSESNLIPIDKAPGGIGETIIAGEGNARTELWWWLVACGALPLLMIEWWVYTRRVHL